MRRSVGLAAAAGVLAISACGAPGAPDGGAGLGATVVRGSQQRGLPTSVPSPDATQTALLLDRLGAIAPGLAGPSAAHAVDRARGTCQTLVGVVPGPPDPTHAARYLVTLADADNITLTDEQADRAVAVIRSTFCPTA